MKQWNVGIVGAGLIADFHARALDELPNARLVAVCAGHLPNAQRLAAKYSCQAYADYESMLRHPGLEVVTIATPSGLHMEPAVAAAKAGKHVICEKPLEVTLERIDAMIDAHERAGTRLGGIFPNRFNDAIAPLRQAIAAGRFGRITYAGAYVPWWRTDDYYKGSWRGTKKLDGGGALMNQSIHAIDMLCDLAGAVDSVQAYTATLGHAIETEDTGVAALRFANGALGVIYGTTASWPGQFKRFEITGTRGTAVYLEDSFTLWAFADEQPQDAEIRRAFGAVGSGGGAADPAAIGHRNHGRNFAAFLEALEQQRPFAIDGREARKAVALILAIYESARSGQQVRMDNFHRP